MERMTSDLKRHPTINRCLKHLSVIGADDKTKQIVYMYMETLYQELSSQIKKEGNYINGK